MEPICILEEETLLFSHTCQGKAREERIPLADGYWSIRQTGDDLSVSPSINCKDCGLHGYWSHDHWITA